MKALNRGLEVGGEKEGKLPEPLYRQQDEILGQRGQLAEN